MFKRWAAPQCRPTLYANKPPKALFCDIILKRFIAVNFHTKVGLSKTSKYELQKNHFVKYVKLISFVHHFALVSLSTEK